MIVFHYHYPGDPPNTAHLMFGEEFIREVRRGKPGEIKISTIAKDGTETETFSTKFDEIVCDRCNAEIQLDDPCALTDHSLFCWDCHLRFNKPYAVRKK